MAYANCIQVPVNNNNSTNLNNEKGSGNSTQIEQYMKSIKNDGDTSLKNL
jgi:hypothetical protein